MGLAERFGVDHRKEKLPETILYIRWVRRSVSVLHHLEQEYPDPSITVESRILDRIHSDGMHQNCTLENPQIIRVFCTLGESPYMYNPRIFSVYGLGAYQLSRYVKQYVYYRTLQNLFHKTHICPTLTLFPTAGM